jgi:thioredoxin-related protein
MIRSVLILFYAFIFIVPAHKLSAATLPDIQNFKKDGEYSEKQHRPIFLYVSAIGCPYCKRLEKDIIAPMLKSGDYEQRLILRKILWEGTNTLFDYQGKEILPDEFLLKYNIMATPTILFLDKDGNEIAKRITGYRTPALYWYYLDTSIDKAVQALKKKGKK